MRTSRSTARIKRSKHNAKHDAKKDEITSPNGIATSPSYLMALLDATADGIVGLDKSGIVQYWNSGAERLFGYTTSEFPGCSITQILPVALQTECLSRLQQVASGMTIPDWEAVGVHKNGSQRDCCFSFTAIYSSETITGLVVTIRDITAQKKVREINGTFSDSDIRYRVLFEVDTIGFMFIENEYILDANNTLLKMLGLTREEITQNRLRWTTLTPPEYSIQDREAVAELMVNQRCTPYEKEYFRKDGSRVPVLVGVSAVQIDPLLGVVSVIDLTVQQEAQAIAHASEERLRLSIEENRNQLRLITDAAPVLIAYIDKEQYFRFNNHYYSLWFERPLREITDRPIREVLGEDAYEGVREYVDRALAGEVVTFESIMPYASAVTRYIHASFVPDRDDQGSVRGYVSVVTDITDFKRAQDEQALSLKEIEALNLRLRRAMTETHHRVKNNLQIIAALIGMQTVTEEKTVPKSDLERIGVHIRSLATVHDMLTQEAKKDGEGNTLSARQILSELLFLLDGTFGDHRLEYVLDDIRLSARQSTSLGIIVNELVSNAMKYGRELVRVTLLRQEGRAVLEVSDDGPGFPVGFTLSDTAQTGLELVENLSRWDLNGQTYYKNRPGGGAVITIIFPLPADYSVS